MTNSAVGTKSTVLSKLEKRRKHNREYTALWRKRNRGRWEEKGCEYRRLWKLAHPEEVQEYNRQWYQRNREQVRRSAKSWRIAHPDSVCNSRRKWRAEHPETMRAMAHRRRARLSNTPGSFDADDIKAMLKKQKGLCFYCKKLMNGKHTIDHCIPLTRNGTSNDPSNIVLACQSCNSTKGMKTLEEFAEYLSRKRVQSV